MRLGTQIARFRGERKLSQASLAEEIGIDVRSLQRIEAGRTAPSLPRLRTIAEVLEVDVARLLTDGSERSIRTKRSTTVARDAPTRDEAAVLRVWSRVPDEHRQLALQVLRLIASHRD